MLLALGVALSSTPVAASSPSAHWALGSVPATRDYPLRSVACTSKGCVAMAEACSPGGCGGPLPGKAFSSSDAGAEWSAGGWPEGTSNPDNIACGSATFCVLSAEKGSGSSFSYAILVTHNAGASFSVHDETSYTTSAAACASAKACLVLAEARSSDYTTTTLRTTNAGATWTAAAFPGKDEYVNYAACGSATDCVAIGTSSDKPVAFHSVNDGASWKKVSVPSAFTGGLSSLSCTAGSCIALSGTQVLLSKNGGSSWTLHGAPSTDAYRAGACEGATCVLVGFSETGQVPVAVITKNGGATWVPQVLPRVRGSLSAVSCTRTFCVAVGDRVLYTGATATSEQPLAMTY